MLLPGTVYLRHLDWSRGGRAEVTWSPLFWGVVLGSTQDRCSLVVPDQDSCSRNVKGETLGSVPVGPSSFICAHICMYICVCVCV